MKYKSWTRIWHQIGVKDDILVAVFLVLFSGLIWWISRYLPYFWDSSGFFIHTARAVFTSNFTSFVGVDTNFAHPTLMQTLLALMWSIFGNSLLVSHVFMFPFLPIYLVSAYFWLKTYLKLPYAFVGSACLIVTPVVLAEYFMIYADLPAAALAISAAALVRYKHLYLGYLVFSLALMTKLPVITLLPYLLLITPKKEWKLAAIPISAVIGWLVYHYKITGWWLAEPGREFANITSIDSLLNTIKIVVRLFFFSQGRWMWLGAAAVSAAIWWYQKKRLLPVHEYFHFIFPLTVSLIFFVISKEYMNRYALYVLPFYIAAVLYSLQHYVLNKITAVLLCILMAAAPLFYWKTRVSSQIKYDFFPPDTVSVLDSITIFRQLATYLQYAAPHAEIYGGFPENAQLLEPYQGYVIKPLNFKSCGSFNYSSQSIQLVVLHPYSPSQMPCRKLFDSQNLIPMHKFEQNGKWIELYQIGEPKD